MQLATLSTRRRSDFLPVPTATFPASHGSRYQVYIRDADSGKFRLFSIPDCPMTATDLSKLAESGIATVYLETAQYDQFQEQLRQTFATDVKDESIPVAQRFGILNEVVRGVLRDTFRWASPVKVVEQSQSLANHVVDLICR